MSDKQPIYQMIAAYREYIDNLDPAVGTDEYYDVEAKGLANLETKLKEISMGGDTGFHGIVHACLVLLRERKLGWLEEVVTFFENGEGES